MRLLFLLLALVAVSLAAREGRRKYGKHTKRDGEHSKVMECLKECKKCMKDMEDPDEDDDALDCYKDHLECTQDIDFGKNLKSMPTKDQIMKKYPKIGQFKKCFGELESCASDSNDVEVVQCAAKMRSCMTEGEGEKADFMKKLPGYVQKVIRKYLRCSERRGQGEKRDAQCVRNHITSVRRMGYGYQMSACINKMFFCQNKVDSDAGVCCSDFMSCKKAITVQEPKEISDADRKHPMAKKAMAVQQCLVNFEKQHGTVSDEVCIEEFSSCIIKAEMPMVPGRMLKHGHCLRKLKECNPANAEDATSCMSVYHDCLGSMMHWMKKMKREYTSDEDEDDE